jgi:hypothetical protein
MKYLAIFMIVISISAQSLNVYSTVVHVQSSKGKHLKASKPKPIKKVDKCHLKQEKITKTVTTSARIGHAQIYRQK